MKRQYRLEMVALAQITGIFSAGVVGKGESNSLTLIVHSIHERAGFSSAGADDACDFP